MDTRNVHELIHQRSDATLGQAQANSQPTVNNYSDKLTFHETVLYLVIVCSRHPSILVCLLGFAHFEYLHSGNNTADTT